MRRLILLLPTLLVFSLLGSDSPRDYNEATEAVGVEGRWQLTEYVFKGETRKPDFQAVITCHNGSFTCEYSTGDKVSGRYCTDTACEPPHLDWRPSNGNNQGQVLRFIYRLRGNILLVGGVDEGEQRPRSFNDQLIFVSSYKRVK
jgi:uncharacterized protein (TIGR03067 family)